MILKMFYQLLYWGDTFSKYKPFCGTIKKPIERGFYQVF